MHSSTPLIDAGIAVDVTARVKPGREAEYERLVEDMLAAASGFVGHVRSGITCEGGGTYQVTIAFDDADHYRAWEDSAQRNRAVRSLPALLAESTEQRRISGLDLWVLDATGPRTPPRWKIAIVTWLGIFPTVVLLVLAVGAVIPREQFLLWGNLTVTILCTIAMTYLVMPSLTRLLARWLDAEPAAAPAQDIRRVSDHR